MYGHEVFAVLTPRDRKNKAGSAFKLKHNSEWFQGATGGVAEAPTLKSREVTPAEDFSSDEESDAVDRLVITFDGLLKHPLSGLQFGTSQDTSHILLGYRGTRGISAKQYNVTVDDSLCIWLQDHHSTHGTAVGYNGQNQKEVRKKEQWILAYEPGRRNRFRDITVHSGGLVVQIAFPNHEAGAPEYIKNLRRFVKKCKKSATDIGVTAIGALGLESEASTEAPSECPTATERLIYYDDGCIGSGSFGQVHRVVRARDGEVFAAKRFRPPPTKRKLNEDTPAWLEGIWREFTVMKDNPHPNVMKVFEFQETPDPVIIMDYYPLGSIDAHPIEDDGYVSAFGQALDGLRHLHANGVAHRDLKPENLLFQQEPCFKVVITDFGMAKIVTGPMMLTTFCGSLKYAAPEVFPGTTDGYGFEVDLWSLGVIVLEWIYGIPNTPTTPILERREKDIRSERWLEWLTIWSRRLLDKLGDEENDQVVDILVHMLQVDVRKRWSAMKCLQEAFRKGLLKRGADNLVVCADRPSLPTREEASKETPGGGSPLSGFDPNETIVFDP